jgi:hypothetical protein
VGRTSCQIAGWEQFIAEYGLSSPGRRDPDRDRDVADYLGRP